MDKIVEQFLKYGLLPACLLIILFLIVQDPDRAVKIKALLTRPFFILFRWFSKSHIESKVASNVNEFLSSSIFSQLTTTDKYKVKVKWVETPTDPILSENGTLILRLKEEDDQTRNILSAVHTALPHVLCPLIRKNINSTCTSSIDLTILKKLSDKLGTHGKVSFKKYFLDPQTEVDVQISSLILKLQRLDENGFLVPIFLNELDILSHFLYSNNDFSDYSEQVLSFLEYLLTIVDRERGSEIQLEYLIPPFKVSTILLAKAHRADTQGLKPYLKRLKTNLDKGSESIYIISYYPAFPFFDRLLKALDNHDHVFVKKVIKTSYENVKFRNKNELKISFIARNDVYADALFEQKLNEYGLKEGVKVKGIIEDISANESMVNVLGMTGYITKQECSWIKISNCKEVFEIGKEFDFLVKNIDKGSNLIYLTLKHPENNPWNKVDLPMENDIVEVVVNSKCVLHFNCIYKDVLEVYIPMAEASWFFLTDNQAAEFIGRKISVKVIAVDTGNQIIQCSIRQLEDNPWPIIHQSLKVGMSFTGKVNAITPNYVQVQLPNNYLGILPKESLDQAGHEYKNFQDNMLIGQILDVYISKVFIDRQRIRLDLSRNKKQ